jgi:hypothetical protein
MILAEHALQIASGKKYGTGSILSHQHRFFTKMGAKGGNPGLRPDAAETCLSLYPVYPATSWAKCTPRKLALCLSGPGPDQFRIVPEKRG